MLWPLSIHHLQRIWRALHPQFKVRDTNLILEGCHFQSQSCQKGDIFFALPGRKTHGWYFRDDAYQKGAALIVVGRDMDINEQREDIQNICIVDDAYLALHQLAVWSRSLLKKTYIMAIGGSCGKTSCKDLVTFLLRSAGYEVLATRHSQNGRLGIPLTLCSRELRLGNPIPEYFVVEVGIDQIGEMEKHVNLLQPHGTALTSLGLEHTAGLMNLEAIIQEETLLLRGSIFWNLNDPLIRREALRKAPLLGGYGVLAQQKEKDVEQEIKEIEEIISIDRYDLQTNLEHSQIRLWDQARHTVTYETSVKIWGRAQVQIATLALTIFRHIQRENRTIPTLEDFKGPSGRFEVEKWSDKFWVIKDYYNSNPLSLKAALEFCQDSVSSEIWKILLLGDMLELGDYEEAEHEYFLKWIGQEFKKTYLVLVGPKWAAALKRLLEKKAFPEKEIEWECVSSSKENLSLENSQWRLGESIIVLLKGSRGIKMENLIPQIKDLLNRINCATG